MPSNANNRPLKNIGRHPKPVTPLQAAFLAQKKKDQRQTRQSQSQFNIRKEPLASNVNVTPQQPDWANSQTFGDIEYDYGDEEVDPTAHTNLQDYIDNDDWEDEDSEYDSEDEYILSGLRRREYDRRRLNQEVQWHRQCSLMVAPFLRCRKKTSDWGNWINCHQDFKSPCSCPVKSKRTVWVDLVDLLIRSVKRRFKEVEKRLVEAESALHKIQAQHPTHTIVYLETQWNRQRELQRKIISESAKDKRAQLSVLIKLEEGLVEARNKLQVIEAKSRMARTDEEHNALLRLPQTLVLLEQKALDLANELGSKHFHRSSDVSKAEMIELLYWNLVQETSRLWMTLDYGLEDVMNSTAQYFDGAHVSDQILLNQWRSMRARTMAHWDEVVDIPALIAKKTNEDLMIEH
ncbi:uncharacterized protein MELLADRAFT_104168 [Melampsora larici-populina 98AG31]|uniref:CxC1-like cysteine cluster associated with KDZ transposases domain-containing protein n=1 Tax=Melampsora larici-populina (strain 98AG31 / pathotype 3-4-7) TaxID=747676 RepID=F4RDT2_MELLP|nr:uncharacterized protein MELLADRAFT_104168 [Melampsora larici-populina 98AG31]EGG09555.1 hypothetical protein MELLADRAFT_104168 [Melampsora larici-populina 98AG31]